MSLLDLTDTKEAGRSLLPNGTYFVILDECEIKTTRAGTGEYINSKFKVLEGDHSDRFLFHTFNIKNENAKAVEIGLGQLKSFMKCAGVTDFKLNNVLDLVGLRCDAIVKTRTDDTYGDKNVISYFKPHDDKAATEAKKSGAPF